MLRPRGGHNLILLSIGNYRVSIWKIISQMLVERLRFSDPLFCRCPNSSRNPALIHVKALLCKRMAYMSKPGLPLPQGLAGSTCRDFLLQGNPRIAESAVPFRSLDELGQVFRSTGICRVHLLSACESHLSL